MSFNIGTVELDIGLLMLTDIGMYYYSYIYNIYYSYINTYIIGIAY